jgi:hypothetical protein
MCLVTANPCNPHTTVDTILAQELEGRGAGVDQSFTFLDSFSVSSLELLVSRFT